MRKNISDKLKYLVILLVLSWMVQANAAQNPKYEEGKLYRHTLSNGLQVLTVERHIAPLIYHQLTYKVGSRNERLGITGVSHIVEHMMFKGTKKYGKGTVSKTISENSGIFNAFTANDMTSYYEYLPKNKIELAMDIESDRMQNSTFDPVEFKPEVEVIKQERRMRSESTPKGMFQETMNSVAYDSHPNRDPIIGWPGDLNKITRDEAYEYYKTYYTPNNAFLVLVGDFDTDKILETVKKYYEKIPKGPEVKEINAVEQPQKVRKTFTLSHNDITEPAFRMSFHIPTYQDPDAAVLKIAGMILGEKSRDARLYKRLVEKEQIATVASGGFGLTKDPGLFSIGVGMKSDSSMDRAEKMIWEEIALMQKEPVSDRELQKVKNRYKFSEVTSYTKNADIGTRLSRYEAYFNYELMSEFSKRVHAVTKDDIIRVMNKYFSPEMVTIGYSVPKEKGAAKKSTKENAGVEKEDDNAADQANLLPDDEFYFKSPLELYETVSSKGLDEVIKPKEIKPSIKMMKLDNGVKIYTVENHLVPSMTIVGRFETGNILEANEGKQPGIAAVLGDVMARGSENMSYTELSERMAFVPFQFQIGGSYRGFTFQGFSLNEDSDEMMKTTFDIVTKPGLKDEDIAKVKPRHESTARNMLKQTSMQAFYYMYNTLYNDHPYSKVKSTEESIKSITRDDLKNLHKKYFRPENLTLLMVGDMKPEEMKELANKYFGKWKNETKAPELVQVPKVKDLTKKEIKVFSEKDYTECTINLGFNPFNNVDPDEKETISVLNYILASSALTSRMGIELRDKQGLIYGLKSEFWAPTDNIGYWKFQTKTGPKNVEKVITGIFKEIRKLLENGITDEELIAAKNRQLGLLPFYIETPDDVASIAYDLILDKRPLDSFDKKGQRIVSITKEDVMRVAKKYFTMDKFIVVVDGPIEEHSLDHLTDKL
ncbi:MAG: M16 family metallopeptidase [Ignavibacteriales bacterium]